MKKDGIKIVFGLGNEGKEFRKTPHNIGKDIIDFYLKEKKETKTCYYDFYNNLILASNKSFMNESGIAVKEILEKFKLKTENLLVIHDEADIIFPYFKFSFKSGSAGHKGVESVIKELKSKNFWRLRIGIQKEKRIKAEKIVLEKWSKKEEEIIEKIKKKFKIILDKLENYLPNELNLPKDFFFNEKNY